MLNLILINIFHEVLPPLRSLSRYNQNNGRSNRGLHMNKDVTAEGGREV